MYSDRDGDSYCDEVDAFPDDPNEFSDLDGDGVGDFSDAFPFDPNEQLDQDLDGWGDNSDMCPSIPQEIPPDGFTEDSSQQEDSDGIFWTWGDEGCPDEDDDGFHQAEDCDDLDANLNPDIEEIEDGIDNNCNTYVDEGYLLPYIANLTFSESLYYYGEDFYCLFEVFNPSGAPFFVDIGAGFYNGLGIYVDIPYFETNSTYQSFNLTLDHPHHEDGRGIAVCNVWLSGEFSQVDAQQSAETAVKGEARVVLDIPTIEISQEEGIYCEAGDTLWYDTDGDEYWIVEYEWWKNGTLLVGETERSYGGSGSGISGNLQCAYIVQDHVDLYYVTSQLSN